MPAAVEEKSMVPTVLVGIGGTGNEILSRLRRLIEESYLQCLLFVVHYIHIFCLCFDLWEIYFRVG